MHLQPGSEVNAMIPAYASKLGLTIRPTNVGTQIDSSILKTYMALVSFQVKDKLKKTRCFFHDLFRWPTPVQRGFSECLSSPSVR